jgi:hypothetical protein
MVPPGGPGTPLALAPVRSQLTLDENMLLNLFYCYLSGQHDFGVQCAPGEIYLRCIHCGKRSHGWALSGTAQAARKAPTAGVKRDAAAGKRTTRSAAPVVASV